MGLGDTDPGGGRTDDRQPGQHRHRVSALAGLHLISVVLQVAPTVGGEEAIKATIVTLSSTTHGGSRIGPLDWPPGAGPTATG